ncbi:MAG: hypothetical protein E7208_02885 [Clostridium butyricum]|nr:hypothetical protein [Clostridium butyricum]
MINKDKNRDLNIDIMRVICSIFIVIIHIIDFYFLSYNQVGNSFWQFINIFESSIRFAVPIFFMISGALLIKNFNESIKNFYKKRLFKLVVPYILISIAYSIGNQIIKTNTVSVNSIVKNIISFDAHYHLWFFEPLIILYLITPLIRKLILFLEKNNKNIIINIYLVLWIVLGIIIPTVVNIYNHTSFRYGIQILNYLGYFILGYAIRNYYKKLFYNREKLLILMYSISMIITFFGNCFYLNSETGIYNNYFIVPSTLNIYIEAFSVFMYFNIKEVKLNMFKQNIVNMIGECSLYIYLLHPIFILILKDFLNINLFVGNLYFKCFLSIFIVVILTVVASIMANKVFDYFIKKISVYYN